jgi:hypothetical protein
MQHHHVSNMRRLMPSRNQRSQRAELYWNSVFPGIGHDGLMVFRQRLNRRIDLGCRVKAAKIALSEGPAAFPALCNS